VISFTPRPLYPQGKSSRYSLNRRLGGPQSRFERGGEEKTSPRWDSSPDHLARSPMLYHSATRAPQMLGCCVKLRYDRFPTHLFRTTIHNHPVTCYSTLKTIDKALLNKTSKQQNWCVIRGSHGEVNRSGDFLDCCSVWCDDWKPTFRRPCCLHLQGWSSRSRRHIHCIVAYPRITHQGFLWVGNNAMDIYLLNHKLQPWRWKQNGLWNVGFQQPRRPRFLRNWHVQ
jgi:hypothetical protein